MQDDWLLDVLTDLRTFADKKGLNATADALAEACLLAAADLKRDAMCEGLDRTGTDGDRTGKLFGGHTRPRLV